MLWEDKHIKRILLDLALKVTETPFYGTNIFYDKKGIDWTNDIGLDSIQLMQLSVEAGSFFNIMEMDRPPYLLSYSGVDEWVQCILEARKKINTTVNFRSSGTTGSKKVTSHSTKFLDREIKFLSSLFQDATHIIPYVASYSLYGFLFTVGLQQELNIPVIYPSDIQLQYLPAKALIVATPFHWQHILATSSSNFDCNGVSSGSPLYDTIFQDLTNRNVRLTELYGSTETAGVAYRQNWLSAFILFPYWELTGTKSENAVEDQSSKLRYPLMDEVVKTGARTIAILGRRDKKIKIAEKLVDLEYIESVITRLPNIRQCNLFAKRIENEVVLYALIDMHFNNEKNRAAATSTIRLSLKPHEIPKRIVFG